MYGGGAAANKLVKTIQGETADTQLPADALNPLQNAQALAQTLPGQPAPAAEQPASVAEETQPEAAPRDIDSLAEQIAIERGIPLARRLHGVHRGPRRNDGSLPVLFH